MFADELADVGPRTRAVVTVVLLGARPIVDETARGRAVDAVLSAISLEGIGVTGRAEWADRLVWQASTFALARRFDEARMVAAAARILAA
jgi:hypothetical protein